MFSSVVPRDPWQYRAKASSSIRAAKALETVLKQQPNHVTLIAEGKKGSPRRMINKDLEVKTYEYKVFKTQDEDNSNNAHHRSSSTGQAFRNVSPNNPNTGHIRRQSNTARTKKTTNQSVGHQKTLSMFNQFVQKPETVESIMKNIHSSGYYVSAMEKIKKRVCAKSPVGYRLPPEPPVNLQSYAEVNMDEILRMRQENMARSEVSSGPVRQLSNRDDQSPIPDMHSPKNFQGGKVGNSEYSKHEDDEESQNGHKTTKNQHTRSLFTSKYRTEKGLKGQTHTLKSLIDNYFHN